MQVLKFGGSSVGSAEAINQMVAIVSARMQKEKTIVVVRTEQNDQFRIEGRDALPGCRFISRCERAQADCRRFFDCFARGQTLVLA